MAAVLLRSNPTELTSLVSPFIEKNSRRLRFANKDKLRALRQSDVVVYFMSHHDGVIEISCRNSKGFIIITYMVPIFV